MVDTLCKLINDKFPSQSIVNILTHVFVTYESVLKYIFTKPDVNKVL